MSSSTGGARARAHPSRAVDLVHFSRLPCRLRQQAMSAVLAHPGVALELASLARVVGGPRADRSAVSCSARAPHRRCSNVRHLEAVRWWSSMAMRLSEPETAPTQPKNSDSTLCRMPVRDKAKAATPVRVHHMQFEPMKAVLG